MSRPWIVALFVLVFWGTAPSVAAYESAVSDALPEIERTVHHLGKSR